LKPVPFGSFFRGSESVQHILAVLASSSPALRSPVISYAAFRCCSIWTPPFDRCLATDRRSGADFGAASSLRTQCCLCPAIPSLGVSYSLALFSSRLCGYMPCADAFSLAIALRVRLRGAPVSWIRFGLSIGLRFLGAPSPQLLLPFTETLLESPAYWSLS
jgi:hypothetical protein